MFERYPYILSVQNMAFAAFALELQEKLVCT